MAGFADYFNTDKIGEFAKGAFMKDGKPNRGGAGLAFGLTAVGMLLGWAAGGGIGVLLGGLLLGGLGIAAGGMLGETTQLPPTNTLTPTQLASAAEKVKEKGDAIVIYKSGLDTDQVVLDFSKTASDNQAQVMQPIKELDNKIATLSTEQKNIVTANIEQQLIDQNNSRKALEAHLAAYDANAVKLRAPSMIEKITQQTVEQDSAISQMTNSDFLGKTTDAITDRRVEILKQLQQSQKDDRRSMWTIDGVHHDETVYKQVTKALQAIKGGNTNALELLVIGQSGEEWGVSGASYYAKESTSDYAKKNASLLTDYYELSKLQRHIDNAAEEISKASLVELRRVNSPEPSSPSIDPSNMVEAPKVDSPATPSQHADNLGAILQKGLSNTPEEDPIDSRGFVPGLSNEVKKPQIDFSRTA